MYDKSIWKPNKVEICMRYLKNYDLVCSNYEVIDNKNSLKEKSFYSKNPISKSFFLNIKNMPFHGCCMAFKKDILNIALPFPEKLSLHDNWIGILLSLNSKLLIKYIGEPLISYRQHNFNVSGVSTNSFIYKIFYRIEFCIWILFRMLKNK